MTRTGSPLEVHMFPCLNDNYAFLLHDADAGITAAVDTPEVGPIVRELNAKGWRLTHILNTHHHGDHAGGNLELKAATACRIVGPRADSARIPGIDVEVGDGDEFTLGGHRVRVFDTPGHTRGHIVYHLPDDGVAFVGDTLFAMGCGRLFEGSAEQMWSSLQKLLAWPEDTRIYCAHEYTEANARFALSVEPGNAALVERANEVERLRRRNVPTVPTTLSLERATNPFLRPWSPNLRETIGLTAADDVDVFARTRALKDAF
jgi:hydroxyacylglutathione hydrolase